jgi:polyisoprenoid-binding protein YceI
MEFTCQGKKVSFAKNHKNHFNRLAMKTIILSAIAAAIFWTGCTTDHVISKQQYLLDQTSVAEWKGSMPGTFNTGSFDVESEDLQAENGQIKSGTFIIPIASIKNFNLPDELKPQLLGHLQSADFFNVVLHPTATFKITGITPYTGTDTAAVAGANYLVTGDFTMIGKTNAINFPAKIVLSNDKLITEAKFQINRTLWGMNYATDPKAEGHYIYSDVDIHLKISGTKK